jgi:hypothetical protein
MDMRAGKDELSPLAGRLMELAASRGLVVIPVVPDADDGPQVHLGPDDMTAEVFVELAADAGAKLFYLKTPIFDVDEPVEPVEEAGELDAAALKRFVELRRAAARFTGWATGLQAAFAFGGVVHHWAIVARWHADLEDELAEIFPGPGAEPVDSLPVTEQNAIIDEVADGLLQLSEFRAATGDQGRRRVARIHLSARTNDPAGPVPEPLVYRAITTAVDRAAAEEQRHYATAEQKIPELARLIAAEPAYQAARTAAVRKHRARDCLLRWANGYPPPTRILDLVLNALPVSRTGREDPAPMLPFTPG